MLAVLFQSLKWIHACSKSQLSLSFFQSSAGTLTLTLRVSDGPNRVSSCSFSTGLPNHSGSCTMYVVCFRHKEI